MNEREIISHDYVPKEWIESNDIILSEEEVDVEIGCECGNNFWIYVPDCPYRCKCGKVYRARISVDKAYE